MKPEPSGASLVRYLASHTTEKAMLVVGLEQLRSLRFDVTWLRYEGKGVSLGELLAQFLEHYQDNEALLVLIAQTALSLASDAKRCSVLVARVDATNFLAGEDVDWPRFIPFDFMAPPVPPPTPLAASAGQTSSRFRFDSLGSKFKLSTLEAQRVSDSAVALVQGIMNLVQTKMEGAAIISHSGVSSPSPLCAPSLFCAITFLHTGCLAHPCLLSVCFLAYALRDRLFKEPTLSVIREVRLGFACAFGHEPTTHLLLSPSSGIRHVHSG
jgi:hypothetical protein